MVMGSVEQRLLRFAQVQELNQASRASEFALAWGVKYTIIDNPCIPNDKIKNDLYSRLTGMYDVLA